MVGARGIEPLTFCVSSKRSNQLSYAPRKMITNSENVYGRWYA